jgi:eukaryotic-like serine/threonine-protein kinase
MTSEHWRRVEGICQAALEREAGERSAFLSVECGDDAELRREVEALLAHERSAEGFLERPVGAVAAHVMYERTESLVGRRIGPHEIVSPLGAGGMGEVYRARDTQLGRDVAIKVLPPAFIADRDRLTRFEREARVLATLNHPHIGAIYGVEAFDFSAGSGQMARALILELVEGETLAERIGRTKGQRANGIGLTEAIAIAKQIADALDAAHEKGIVHRDLKPANIKITPDGVVKVLDFGLAKGRAASVPEESHAPTMTMSGTAEGTVLGTVAYMSPEQARGQAVDRRTDIWAFGCVLYEMLTGRAAFSGATVSDHIAAILERDPDWNALPAATPPMIRRLLRRCLERDSKGRLRDIADARVELDETTAAPSALDAAVTTLAASAPHGRLAWMTATVAILVAAALAIPAVRYLRETQPLPPPETRTEIVTPATDSPLSFALSPDGRQIVFVASGDGASRLWLRSLATTTAQPLAETEGATWPFWAPDSRSIGFFAGNALKRIDLGGGAPQTLAPVTNGRGGTWNADGVIVFAPSLTTPLMRVSATGGAAAPLTTLGPKQQGHVAPYFLPDGRRLLFQVLGGRDTVGIYLGSIDGLATRLIPTDGAVTGAVFLPAGHTSLDQRAASAPRGAFREAGWLLWVRAGTLVAQRLDVAKAALAAEPVTVAADTPGAPIQGAVSVATTGVAAYRAGTGSKRQLTWMDRSGTVLGIVGDTGPRSNPRVSPDGRRVVVTRSVQGYTNIWLLDGTRTSRLTFDVASENFPLWSPDGTRIVFHSNRTDGGVYQKPTSGAGVEERLVASDRAVNPTSWSADGRFLLYNRIDPQTDSDLWVLPMVGDHTSFVFLKTRFRERWGAFSPDDRWVAYHSDESGRNEVYIRPFVPPDAAGSAAGSRASVRLQPDQAGGQLLSTAGGIMPVWRHDGKELYYVNPAGAMMAVPITITGAALDPGAPLMLFPTRIWNGGEDTGLGRQYDVAPDGRFLINTQINDTAAPITLLMNWHPEAKK